MASAHVAVTFAFSRQEILTDIWQELAKDTRPKDGYNECDQGDNAEERQRGLPNGEGGEPGELTKVTWDFGGVPALAPFRPMSRRPKVLLFILSKPVGIGYLRLPVSNEQMHRQEGDYHT